MVFNTKNIWKSLGRKKVVDQSFESPLRRCLVFLDLFLLGVGGSVDVALYVVLGNVIRDISGPAVIISMVIGFGVSFGSGLCYAEFSSYIPSSGSDYDYVYASLGEIWGFFDGWSVLVASVLATAVLAQGAGELLSSLTNSATYEIFDSHVSLPEHPLLAPNINFMAAIIIILVTIITGIGVQGSIRFNDVIVVINILVVLFTFVLGLCYINFDNWSSWDKFAPYGTSGILKALPVTIFFYGGFVSVTFSSEEVINPHKMLPKSILSSLVGIFVLFFIIAVVTSLAIPYHQLPKLSPLSDGFGMIAFKGSKHIIAIGGFCSCFSSVLTASYANSRLSYVISRDGLITRFLSKVNKRTLVPVNAVFTTGLIGTTLAALFDLTILVEMCSILAVIPYMLLCLAIITLRYKEELISEKVNKDDDVNKVDIDDKVEDFDKQTEDLDDKLEDVDKETEVLITSHAQSGEASKINVINGSACIPTIKTRIKFRIKVALVILILSTSALSLVVRYVASFDTQRAVFGIVVVVVFIPVVGSFVVIYKTPHQNLKFPFTIPCFPLLPTACLAMCTFIMLQFTMWAWILCFANCSFGLIIYLGYGMKHSKVDDLHLRKSIKQLTTKVEVPVKVEEYSKELKETSL